MSLVQESLRPSIPNLAGGRAGNVGALGRGLASGDLVTGPGPVRAGTLGAQDVDVGGRGSDRAGNLANLEVGDGDAGGGSASRAAVLVVLLNDDTVLGNVGQGDAGVLDVGDGAGGAVDGLDADAVVAVGDGAVLDADGLDDVVGAAADGADGETVATAAGAAGEGDVGARVDGEAVVLVLDDGARDVDASGGSDVEGVGVVATGRVTGRVVQVDIVDTQGGGAVDAESLDGGVLHAKTLDPRVLEGVGVEELGLGLAAVASLSVPPSGTASIDGVARGTLDSDGASREGDQRAFPLLVAERGGALESDLLRVSGWLLEVLERRYHIQ